MIKQLSTSDIQEIIECIIKEIKNAEIIIKNNNLTGPNSLDIPLETEPIHS